MEGHCFTETRIGEYELFLRKEEKSENTIRKYVRDVRAFTDFAGVAEIRKNIVIAYKNKLLSENYAVRSIGL